MPISPLDHPDATDVERLPCGCRIGTLGGAFAIEPCALSCEHYRYVIEEGTRQDKPVEYRFTDPS